MPLQATLLPDTRVGKLPRKSLKAAIPWASKATLLHRGLSKNTRMRRQIPTRPQAKDSADAWSVANVGLEVLKAGKSGKTGKSHKA